MIRGTISGKSINGTYEVNNGSRTDGTIVNNRFDIKGISEVFTQLERRINGS